MRITFVLPHAGLAGGMRVLAIYANRLRQRGHEVTVVSIPLARKTLRSKLKSLLLERRWPKDPEPEPSYFDQIDVRHHILEAVRPVVDSDVPDADVVLATFWKTGPWVAALAPSKGAKAILLQGYETSPGQEDPAIDAVWRLPLHKILISRWLVQLAKERFGDSNTHHVPNSVDLEQFHAPARGRQAVPTVGMTYVPLHLKGPDVCLAALDLVKKKIPNLRVVAFGAYHESPEWPLIEGREYFYRPPQENIRNIYAQCDVWLCGSRREGFHLPPLEAMACRCPVVSTSVGGPQDIIVGGVNGYLVNVDDVGKLADQIMRVLSFDDARWREMSDAAYATATGYTWDDATRRLESALEAIVRNH